MNGTLVEKEQLSDYTLVPAFVDKSEYWAEKLSYAVRLGNEFKGKTKLTLESNKGPISVETTIWTFDGKFLQLKGGVLIPLNSIIDVQWN